MAGGYGTRLPTHIQQDFLVPRSGIRKCAFVPTARAPSPENTVYCGVARHRPRGCMADCRANMQLLDQFRHLIIYTLRCPRMNSRKTHHYSSGVEEKDSLQ